MKAAITFIVLGALLIMTPALSDHLYWQSVQTLISKGPVNDGTMYCYFSARMGYHYQLGFWSAGAAMVGVALLVLRPGKTQQNGADY